MRFLWVLVSSCWVFLGGSWVIMDGLLVAVEDCVSLCDFSG